MLLPLLQWECQQGNLEILCLHELFVGPKLAPAHVTPSEELRAQCIALQSVSNHDHLRPGSSYIG